MASSLIAAPYETSCGHSASSSLIRRFAIPRATDKHKPPTSRSGRALEKRPDELKEAWADMVPVVLWSNRTTEKEATGETPFRLAFGAEAVLPAEVGLPNWRVLNYEPELNGQLHKEDLNLLPEVRLAAELKSAAYKDRISKAYNKRVRSRLISKGDFVLRRTTTTGKAHMDGKLTANWEGPYFVKEEIVPGSYRVEDISGKLLKNSWNASVLKRYYV